MYTHTHTHTHTHIHTLQLCWCRLYGVWVYVGIPLDIVTVTLSTLISPLVPLCSSNSIPTTTHITHTHTPCQMWVYWKMSLAVESIIIMSDSILNNEVSSEVGKGQTNETITHSAVTFYLCQIWYMCACLYVGRYSPLTDSVTLSRSNTFTHKMFTALMTVEDTSLLS